MEDYTWYEIVGGVIAFALVWVIGLYINNAAYRSKYKK